MTTPTTPRVEPEDGAALLSEVRDTLAAYAVLTDEHERSALALWVAATYAVPAWEHAPRLIIRPARGVGRCYLWPVLEALTPSPVSTALASPAWILRALATSPHDPPTLLVEDPERYLTGDPDDARDVGAVLSAGFERGRNALRYNAATREVETVPTFAMAAILTPANLPEHITERAVTVRPQRPTPGQFAAYRVRRDRPRLDALGARLAEWVRTDLDALRDSVPPLAVTDRAADLWEPLTAVADLAGGGHWPAAARQAAVALTVPALTV